VHPVLIGRGKRLFPESGTSTGLRLIQSRAFGNGVVLLRYECDSAATTTVTITVTDPGTTDA
jgi:hypothetical protein